MLAAIPMMAAPPAIAQPAHSARTLYVTNGESGSISTFVIGPGGALAKLGKPVAVEGEPRGTVFSPDGTVAYAVDTAGSLVIGYRVSPNGSLSRLPDPAPTGASPFGIAIAPDGGTVYTANTLDSTVSVLAVGPGGGLSPLGPPVPTGAANPRGIALSPDGRFLFTANGISGDFEPDTVSTFAVNADGTVTLLDDSTPIGAAGIGIVVSPDGRFLYVDTEWSAAVFGFAIAPDGGLTPVPGSPFAAEGFPVGAAITADGTKLYVSSGGNPVNPDDSVLTHGFTIGSDGSLTPVPGSPFVSGSGPAGITPTPDGRHLYVTNAGSDDMSGYVIEASGRLREIVGSPFSSGGDRPLFQSAVVRPDQGPVAKLRVGTGRGAAGSPVRFDATASFDPDGHIARYDWDFGDGTVLADGGARARHAYREAGTNTVKLRVTDGEGCAADRIFTGQTLLCNGTAAATITAEVTVG